jgi:hypothetical protein
VLQNHNVFRGLKDLRKQNSTHMSRAVSKNAERMWVWGMVAHVR